MRKTGGTNKEVPMFELLLLIGFVYAGFFPPVPASVRTEKTCLKKKPHHLAGSRKHHTTWVTLKKLVHKKRIC
jgi:hypothetical protein